MCADMTSGAIPRQNPMSMMPSVNFSATRGVKFKFYFAVKFIRSFLELMAPQICLDFMFSFCIIFWFQKKKIFHRQIAILNMRV